MGNESAKVHGVHVEFVEEKEHPYLGSVKLYRLEGRQGNALVAAVRWQENNLTTDLLDHTLWQHPNIISLRDYSQDYAELLTQDYKNSCFYFDYLETSLEDVLETRKKRIEYFFENELMRIAKDALKALDYMQKKDIAHWNIEPKHIFYDLINKCVALYDNQLLRGVADSYFEFKKRKLGGPLTVLATPEITYSLSVDSEEIYLFYKTESDVYQLGLTLLEIASFLPSAEFYNEKITELNYEEIDKRINGIALRYSGEFLELVRLMLIRNAKERPNPEQLLRRFWPNEPAKDRSLSPLPQQLNKSSKYENIMMSEANFFPEQSPQILRESSNQLQELSKNPSSNVLQEESVSPYSRTKLQTTESIVNYAVPQNSQGRDRSISSSAMALLEESIMVPKEQNSNGTRDLSIGNNQRESVNLVQSEFQLVSPIRISGTAEQNQEQELVYVKEAPEYSAAPSASTYSKETFQTAQFNTPSRQSSALKSGSAEESAYLNHEKRLELSKGLEENVVQRSVSPLPMRYHNE